jgi:hypothetical protein
MTLIAQAGDFHIAVNDVRPMWNVLRIIEQKFGWRLNYEDPPDGSSLQPGRIDIIAKAGASPEDLLQSLFQKSPGQFLFKRVGEGYVVAPQRGSILDSPISLPRGEHTIGELAKALTEATGTPFHAAGDYVSQSFGGGSEPAREILLRFLRPGFVYDLLYSPGSGYVLTVHEAKSTVTLPDARKQHRQSRP